MNKYSPFWILNPLQNNVSIRTLENWSFYTTKEVIDGLSPLKETGKWFYQISHNYVGIYDRCLWIFKNKELDFETTNELSRVLKFVSETFCNSLLSNNGFIGTLENGDLIKQPAIPKYYESIGGENLTNDKITRVINTTEIIFQKNLIDYLSIFKYLRNIKNSETFISELALWSFVEQHWIVNENSKNRLAESLKNLGTKVYDRKDPIYVLFKYNLKELIKDTGGKKRNLSDLRNLLAHGTFYKQKENWDDKQWNQYYEVHKFLFEMVILGIEKEILMYQI